MDLRLGDEPRVGRRISENVAKYAKNLFAGHNIKLDSNGKQQYLLSCGFTDDASFTISWTRQVQ